MKDYWEPIPKGCLITNGFMSDPKTILVFCIGSIVLLVLPVGEKYQYWGFLASSGGRYLTEGVINLKIWEGELCCFGSVKNIFSSFYSGSEGWISICSFYFHILFSSSVKKIDWYNLEFFVLIAHYGFFTHFNILSSYCSFDHLMFSSKILL